MTSPFLTDTEPMIEEDKPEAPVTEKPAYGDPTEPGFLLDPKRTPEEIVKWLHETWAGQKDDYAPRICTAEVNVRRRGGEANLWAQKIENENRWIVYGAPVKTIPNQFYRKPDRLCHRLTSQLYQDEGKLDTEPGSGEPEDRDASDLATRALESERSEGRLSDHHKHKAAFDIAHSWGSGYIWYYTDPKGGGRQPMEVMAGPFAQHADEAIDPKMAKAWEGVARSWFVMPDGTLTEDVSQAAMRWIPRLAGRVTSPGHVRLLPAQAPDIWEADAVLYADYLPWGQIKGWFDELEQATPEERDHAIEYRHPDAKHLLPKAKQKKPLPGHEDEGLCLFMCYWSVQCGEYPKGCYVVTVGDKLAPFKGEWILQRKGKEERRDLPFTQVKQWLAGNHPAGQGTMDFIGASGEFRGELYSRFSEMLEKQLNRKVFYSPASMVNPQQMQLGLDTYIQCQGGLEPKYEEVPGPPKELPLMIDRSDADTDDASQLQQAGQGVETPDAQSGRAKLAVISQVHANLSDLNQNKNRALERSGRICLQEIATNYTVPQILSYVGRDGVHKVQRWLGSDLGSTSDVKIRPGTGTMMNPMQKAEMLLQVGPAMGMVPEALQGMLASGLSAMTGAQDDAVRQRIRRQLTQWEDGPPKGWKEQRDTVVKQSMDPMTGQPRMGPPPIDPMTQMPMMGPDGMPMQGQPIPPPPDPLLAQIWKPNPTDTTPYAARIRAHELMQAMCGLRYAGFPPEWTLPVDLEFQRCQQALAPAPPPVETGKPGKPGEGPPAPGAPPKPTAQESAVLQPM